MIVKIGNKEVQLTDYLSANQIKKVLYETYEQGYQDGGSDMEQAKQIIIDNLLKQIEQIREDAIEKALSKVRNLVNIECNPNCECQPDCLYLEAIGDTVEILKQLKEKNK